MRISAAAGRGANLSLSMSLSLSLVSSNREGLRAGIVASPLCPSLPSLSSSFVCPQPRPPWRPQLAFADEHDHQPVIGDCLIFEDGVFEDPYLQQEREEEEQQPIKSKSRSNPNSSEIQPQNLIPEDWAPVVDQINLSKKERRKIAQEMEFGQRIEKKKRLRKVDLEEYLKLRNEKLSQLKPLVLDTPTAFPPKEAEAAAAVNSGGSVRVEPRNPRWAVYGRGFDDITDFFNSSNYQPSPDEKPQGRQKMFTKEEKVLMNARVPKLAVATSEKWLPLHTLAASGEFYLVNTLLKHSVDIDAVDRDGLTALHKAITCKKQAITNFLFRESANTLVRDKDGATLMHYAVRTASAETIKTLLLHNVDVNLQDNDGWTPLHLAVQSRRTDIVRLLLMKGADKTLKNEDGLTPLELCLHSGRDKKTYELVKLLKQLPRQNR